jgi:TonB family protein
MTPRNNMDTADPQATETFEETSGNSSFVDGNEAISTRQTSTRSRRSARIAVTIPVVVRDQFGGREETRTQFVMVRGAVIATNSNVRVGHKLALQIAKTGRAAECTVTSIEPVLKEVHSAEVEFTREQPDFWPVQFPQEDLKTDSGSYRFSKPAAPSMVSPSGSFDGPKREIPGPVIGGSNEFVSLADDIAESAPVGNSSGKHDFSKQNFSKTEKFSHRSAPVDSVAQFRAANRAAHRREQRTKAMYSLLTLATVAVALLGIRYWMQHRAEIAEVKLPQVSLPSKVKLPQVNLPSMSQILPKSKPAEKPATTTTADSEQRENETVASAPTPRAEEITHSTPVSSSGEASAPPVVFELSPPAETQIAVRHAAPSASAHKAETVQDSGEEPQALPLKVDDNNSAATKPQVLNEVVAQTPMKAAMLAPQPVRKATPAKLQFSAPAQYPAMARQIRVEGEVVISLDVDATGKVSGARAVSGPPILRTAAIDAVRRWKYQPATLGDKPVASTEVVKVQFKLK